MRLRILILLIGALLVVATFTFPLWQPYVQNTSVTTSGGEEIFPGLPARLQTSFALLPPDQQRAYFALAAINRDAAVRMVTAALQPGAPAPAADADLPEMNSPELAARGAFTQLDPIRYAQGTALIYIGADDRKVLRLENFTSANNSDLRVILSAFLSPTTTAEMRFNDLDFDVGPLKGTYGNQNYEIPQELNILDYASVVIYSPGIDLIYSVAPLIIFQ